MPGNRGVWVKTKFLNRQEFVIVGWTDPEGSRSSLGSLTDIVEAIERIRHVLGDRPLEGFEKDWERQWLVERGVEIVPEASRHLPPDLKARHPEIPWQKVTGIGNVLRHNYENIRRASDVEAGA